MTNSPYVLVTPAKNEEQFIEKTIASVVAQSVRPACWIIVSDGSTDRTDEIVRSFAKQHDFIRLLRRESGQHCFGSKVKAFQAGCDEMSAMPYEFIGNLDADIELPTDYYEQLIGKFQNDFQLGLAGGTRCDLREGVFVPIRFNSLDIGGAYQLFRRSCFLQVGGYREMELGGEDTIACVSAREHGWKVESIQELVVRHYRPTGAAQGNVVRSGYRAGKKRFQMGYHPVFELVKLLRVRNGFEVIHNACEFFGFFVATVTRAKRSVPLSTATFLRAEQMDRLRETLVCFRDPATVRVSDPALDDEPLTHQEMG